MNVDPRNFVTSYFKAIFCLVCSFRLIIFLVCKLLACNLLVTKTGEVNISDFAVTYSMFYFVNYMCFPLNTIGALVVLWVRSVGTELKLEGCEFRLCHWQN